MINTIDDVVDRLVAIANSLGPRDGVGAFNLVYLRTTEAIRERLGTGFFADDAFVERLAVTFAKRYFAAVDAHTTGRPIDAAWRPLFARRADRRVHAVQFAVAGMNAHINHDLALAVVDTCAAAQTHPLAGSIPDDYQRITDVLEEIESRIRGMLLNDLERELGRPLEPLMHILSSWSIDQARRAAWVRGQVLWILRGTPPLFQLEVTASASTAGMTTRHLLTPLLPTDR
jgi:hypothetical protein